MNRRSLILSTAAFAAPWTVTGRGVAQPAANAPASGPWPNRPLRIVIPWPPGQATDLAGRITAQFLSDDLGQSVVPENRAGAGGMIGTDAVVKAAPDGYTLLAGSSGPISINPLFGRANYDPERDLAAVAMLGLSSYSLVVRKEFPADTAQEFLELLKKNPDKYTFSSSGTGATTHLIVELFNNRAGIRAVHVPFSGSSPSLTAVMAGQVDYTIETLAATTPLVRDGKLKSFGISVNRESPLAPGLVPIAQAFNLPGFDVGAWFGVMVPQATPRPIQERLAEGVRRGLEKPDVRQRFASVGIEVETRALEEFDAYLKRQKEAFANIIKTANITLD
jgi:tripartite-type tricarboxylate transporter receptor subunit TctC